MDACISALRRQAGPEWDFSIKSLPSGLREPCRRGAKECKCQRVAGQQEARPLSQHGQSWPLKASKSAYELRDWGSMLRVCTGLGLLSLYYASRLWFLLDSCVWTTGSPWAFSWALFLLFWPIPMCWFLFSLTIFYYYLLEACLFSNETVPKGWMAEVRTGNYNQDTWCDGEPDGEESFKACRRSTTSYRLA